MPFRQKQYEKEMAKSQEAFMELADDGYLEQISKARSLYFNRSLVLVAAAAIREHRYAFDYLKTAPILILGVSFGKTPKRAVDFGQIAKMFARRCDQGLKLKDMMKSYGLAPQLKGVHGYAIFPSRYDTVIAISKACNPSALAQSVPREPSMQRLWISAIRLWIERCLVRHARTRARENAIHLEWAVQNLRITTKDQLHITGDMYDFAMTPEFNPQWNFDQAYQAMERWHVHLHRQDDGGRFLATYGRTLEEEFGYHGLPTIDRIDDYEFIALNSGASLREEGTRMRHCVASYTNACITGTYAAFSIQKNGKRIATLGLNRSDRGWVVDQIKGHCNAQQPAVVRNAAYQFVKNHKEEKNDRPSGPQTDF